MPIFDITAPNGKQYEVEGADAQGAMAALHQHVGEPSAIADVAKSLPTGVAKGALGLAGTIPAISDFVHEKANKYLFDPVFNKIDQLTGHQHTEPTPEQQPPNVNALASPGSLQKGVESVTGEFHKPETTAGKYADTVGQFLPGALLGPGGVARNAAQYGVLPGLASEGAGQYTEGTAAEPWARVAGGLLGGLTPSLARRAVTPLPATAERTALANTLRGEGVDLTAGQATGNKPLQWMESVLGDTPGAGGRPHEMQTAQGEQFTNAALRRVGENSNRATPDVIDGAFNRIGGQFDALGARNTLNMDRQFATDLTDAVREYNGLVGPTQRAPLVENTVNDIAHMAAQHQGQLTGDVYQAMASRLRTAARGTTDPQTATVLRDLHTAMDNAMERSIATNNPNDLGAWREARNQYRNLMVIEKAATGAGENTAQGLISPSQLRNATVVAHGRRNYARGQGDFADLARAGEGVMKPLPNSGTAPRMYAQHLLSGLGGVVGTSVGGLHGGIAGLAAPAVLGRALMSRPVQAYLGNQAMLPGARGRHEALVHALMSPAARQAADTVNH